tara:strand:+ start:447 stop:629 length:183 start_codon:yes stop_codon:yes gene_type:complete
MINRKHKILQEPIKMNIFITGITVFLGSHLAEHFIKKNMYFFKFSFLIRNIAQPIKNINE